MGASAFGGAGSGIPESVALASLKADSADAATCAADTRGGEKAIEQCERVRRGGSRQREPLSRRHKTGLKAF